MRKAMRVLGMMSGTSADGIDAALVQISGQPLDLKICLERHHHTAFRPPVRSEILRIANAAPTTTAEISELNFRIGEEFARAALEAFKRWRVGREEIELIGSHGQTIFHLGATERFQGKIRPPSTLQIGEISILAERTGITTIGDFRPADMAAGGQGAPLVPFVDYVLYRDRHRRRVALNIGGIANVTVVPAGARPNDVFAFDTGPGNMVIDSLIQRYSRGRHSYDRDAKFALGGRSIPELLRRLLREPYLRKQPPKSTGRELFGQPYTEKVVAWGQRHHAEPADLVRSVTLFTALSIADSFERLILPRVKVDELIVSGGGAKNPLIMAQLAASLPGIEVVRAEKFGVPSEAKEALCFAVLAYERFHERANNLPSATGATHEAVLGKIALGQKR
jgi:anhydro-N-acetylmuramic acid kinase